MAKTNREFMIRALRRVMDAGIRKVKPKIPSRQLRRALRQELIERSRLTYIGNLFIPHYWAIHVHDGRLPFSKGRIMVWFKNPKEDPRLDGGNSPERLASRRHLSKAQMQKAYKRRQDFIAAGGDPYDAPVIITREIKNPTPPNKFFSNEGGMRGFPEQASRIIHGEFSEHVLDFAGVERRARVPARGVIG